MRPRRLHHKARSVVMSTFHSYVIVLLELKYSMAIDADHIVLSDTHIPSIM